jgi:hypothetical protein
MAEHKSSTAAKKKAAEAIEKNADVLYMTPQEESFVEVTWEPKPMTKGEKQAIGVFVTAMAAFVGVIGWAAWKTEKAEEEKRVERQAEWERKRQEREAWFEQQRLAGNLVVEQRDGTYIAIPAEVYAKAPQRKKAL